MRIGAASLLICCTLVGCASHKNYEGAERPAGDLSMLALHAVNNLALLSVDDVQFQTRKDLPLTQKRTLLAGSRRLKFSYTAKIEQVGLTLHYTYLEYQGTCVFKPKHAYIATVRNDLLQVLDVGDAEVPDMPILFGGPTYVRQMDTLAARGIPADCRQDREK